MSATATKPDDALIITRMFNAPRALVFKVWTDPKHLANWFGPRHHPATQMSMDVRPGGKWRGRLQAVEDSKALWLGGVYREVVAPERLVFTFAWEEEGERGLETLVTITFADKGGKTLMTFHQAPFVSVEEREGHTEGWESTFDRLAEHFANLGASEI